MGQIIKQYGVPRWLHTQIEVPGGEELKIDSDAFANSSPHRMRLVALTFGNNGVTDVVQASQFPIADDHPDWASGLLVDVGKSQRSDINLVSTPLTGLCGNPRRQRQMAGAINMGRTYRFPTPYMLPRDEGLYVRVEYVRDPYDIGLLLRKKAQKAGPDGPLGKAEEPTVYGPCTTDEITFIAKGFFEDGYPGMLAGRVDPMEVCNETYSRFQQGSSVEMISADLFNSGKAPLYLTELCFKEMDIVTEIGGGPSLEETDVKDAPLGVYYPGRLDYMFQGTGMSFAWLVNPTNPTATKWMPQSQCIPTGLLTPQCRNFDGGSDGPLAYFFPPATYLDPKQAVSVRLGNTTEYATKLRVCLIGELEVR